MDELEYIRKIMVNTRGYENLEAYLGEELGPVVIMFINKANDLLENQNPHGIKKETQWSH